MKNGGHSRKERKEEEEEKNCQCETRLSRANVVM